MLVHINMEVNVLYPIGDNRFSAQKQEELLEGLKNSNGKESVSVNMKNFTECLIRSASSMGEFNGF